MPLKEKDLVLLFFLFFRWHGTDKNNISMNLAQVAGIHPENMFMVTDFQTIQFPTFIKCKQAFLTSNLGKLKN